MINETKNEMKKYTTQAQKLAAILQFGSLRTLKAEEVLEHNKQIKKLPKFDASQGHFGLFNPSVPTFEYDGLFDGEREILTMNTPTPTKLVNLIYRNLPSC